MDLMNKIGSLILVYFLLNLVFVLYINKKLRTSALYFIILLEIFKNLLDMLYDNRKFEKTYKEKLDLLIKYLTPA